MLQTRAFRSIRAPSHLVPWACCLTLLAAAVTPGALAAQSADVARGYELLLTGHGEIVAGEPFLVAGRSLEVVGLADLRALPGARVTVRLLGHGGDGQPVTWATGEATADAQGYFEAQLSVPSDVRHPLRLEVHLDRGAGGDPGRSWDFHVVPTPGARLELLVDRRLYEPGEPVHVLALLTRRADGRPIGDGRLRLVLRDPNGGDVEVAERVTSPSGAVSHRFTLPAGAAHGGWTLHAEWLRPTPELAATVAFDVGRRTLERLLVDVHLDTTVVRPGGKLRGTVTVRAPSGAPVAGAVVSLRASDDEAGTLEVHTDAQGVASFELDAPSLLLGESSEPRDLSVVVRHPAHGRLTTSASYVLSRSDWIVEATPRHGALVPEVETETYVLLRDPLGRPAPAGTHVEVSGSAVVGGTVRRTTDAHGLLAVPVRVERGAAARLTHGGAGCEGRPATVVEVRVGDRDGAVGRACVAVAPEAVLAPRIRESVVAPGGTITVDVLTSAEARGRPVIVEALAPVRPVAVGVLTPTPGRSFVTLRLPETVTGLVIVRARPLDWPTDGSLPRADERSRRIVRAGALDGVLVRPVDAFALRLDAGTQPWRVRERARVSVSTSSGAAGFVALVARDLTAHAGEEPWTLPWLDGRLQAAVTDPTTRDAETLLRAALAAALGPDAVPPGPPPIEPPPWGSPATDHDPRHGVPTGAGLFRDPVALRDELLRRGLVPAMMALEQALEGAVEDPRFAEGIVRRVGERWVGFEPGVIEELVRRGRLADELARALGGQRLTLAMLEDAELGFSFAAAARRVARRRLVRLIVALARFGDPANRETAAVARAEPPERWLGWMVRQGMLRPADLRDPWGGSFVLRRTTARPRLVLSELAPGYELVSPGPDGRPGTTDDVRDPWARAVPAGTPYSVGSGEDALIRALGTLAPGPRTLEAMRAAYDALGLDAEAERTATGVRASESEADAEGGLGVRGTSAGGGGAVADIAMESFGTVGRGGGVGAGRGRVYRAPQVSAAPPPGGLRAGQSHADARERRTGGGRLPRSGSALAAAGEIVRERFPATLFFSGAVVLEPGAGATVEVPLADALTTYRVEAIGWTASGWRTTASTELRVEREIEIDAPIPPLAAVGDALRIPVRVHNHGARPRQLRIEIVPEGGLSATVSSPSVVSLAAAQSVDAIVEVVIGAAGSGSILLRAVDASDGRPLDAVRRPLRALPDARLVRVERQALVRDGSVLDFETPSQASERGPGVLTVSTGGTLFGLAEHGDGTANGTLHKAWYRAMTHRGPNSHDASLAAEILARAEQAPDEVDLNDAALAVGIGWSVPHVPDAHLEAALRLVASDDPQDIADAGSVSWHAERLVWLAPAVRHADRRPAVRGQLAALVSRLAGAIARGAAAVHEEPLAWVTAAAALALVGPLESRATARARELLRRVDRYALQAGEETWLEPFDDSQAENGPLRPTALLALARAALGDPDASMAALRALLRFARPGEPVAETDPTLPERSLASAALALLVRGEPEAIGLHVDGRDVRVPLALGSGSVSLEGLGRPGPHRLRFRMRPGVVALARLELRYGMPWSASVTRAVPIAVSLDGPIGARDRRAGLAVRVENRGARLLVRPTVQIDLPAGAELDGQARERLASMGRAAPVVEGRTLRIFLRPLPPGGFVRFALPLRWSVGGRLRGLGVEVFDDASELPPDVRPTAVVPSRLVEVADEGPELEEAEHETSRPVPTPPPIPIPCPIPEETGRGGVPGVVRCIGRLRSSGVTP